MKPIKIFFDKTGNTLNVWFDDLKNESISEETSEEIILIRDKNRRVIGLEVLNYLSLDDLENLKNISVETEIL